MDWLLDPFQPQFMQRALLAGVLASTICALVGTWVVLRGLSFMGEALAHGVLPGIALAFVLGVELVFGAIAGAAVMVAGVTLVSRRARLPEDTGIGLLFVGMLALGVIIVSREQSFAVDLTAFLFGDVLGVTWGDLRFLAASAVVAIVLCVAWYRPFLVLAFDARKAATLGLRPRLAHVLLLSLVALAVVTSYQAVGTLLVVGLIVAPPAAASLVTRRLPAMMITAVGLGWLAVAVGLLLSWHHRLAAGASMAGVAVAQFFVLLMVTEVVHRVRGRRSALVPPAVG